jgi:hypothetical protein
MRSTFKIVLFSSFVFFTSARLFGQDINAPYSIIGIGDIDNNLYNRSSGMGNTGISLRSGRTIYQANPASYSALDNQFFNFELAAQGKSVKYAGENVDPLNNSNSDFAVKKAATGFKITKNWGMGVGLTPFSSVSYLFTVQKSIEGTNSSYQAKYDGNGGINNLYWSNGYKLGKHLSLGINTSLLFGSIVQTELITDDATTGNITSTKNIYVHDLHLDYGLQYFTALNKTYDLNMGLIFSNKTSLKSQYTLLVTNFDATTVKNEILKNSNYTFPLSYGAGISVTKNKKLTIAADYKFQDWSSVRSEYNNLVTNSQRYSLGVQYSKFKNVNNYLYEKNYLQAGVYLNNSYVNINNKQISDYGVTVGGGVPVSGRININLALEVGSRGTISNALIKENYSQLTINISYRDLWYTKGKKYE